VPQIAVERDNLIQACSAHRSAFRQFGAYNWRVHFVYIVRCADGTLYTGYARDPRARERAHNRGRGAKYTAGRCPVRLVYQEAFRSVGKALAREYMVKHLTRAQKDALVISARRRHR
jgi:putative endonuclease